MDEPLDLCTRKLPRTAEPLFVATTARRLQLDHTRLTTTTSAGSLLQVHRPLPLRPATEPRQQPQPDKTQQCVLPQCAPATATIAARLQVTTGGGGSAHSANRMSYPREFKLTVIDYYYKNGQNKYRTCKQYRITKSMLNGWLAKLDKIVQSRPGSLKSGRSGRRPQFPAIEQQLYEIYQSRTAAGAKLGNRWLRDTARQLASQQCTTEQLAGMCQFSERWLSNFKKRYNIAPAGATTASGGPQLAQHKIEWNADGGADAAKPSDSCSSSSGCSSGLAPPAGDGDATSCGTPSPSATTCSDTDAAYDGEQESQQGLAQFYAQFPDLRPDRTVSRPHPNAAAQNGQTAVGAQLGRAHHSQSQSQSSAGRRGRKVQFPQVERALFARLVQRQRQGEHISNKWLQEQAKGIAKQLCPGMLEHATRTARCMFSEHWLHNFKRRYGVSLKQQIVGGRHIAAVAAPDQFADVKPTTQQPQQQLQQESAQPQATFAQMLALVQRARASHDSSSLQPVPAGCNVYARQLTAGVDMLAMLQRAAAAVAQRQTQAGGGGGEVPAAGSTA